MKNYREDYELMSALESASNEDLSILIDTITDGGKGRVSLGNEVKDALIHAKQCELHSPIDSRARGLIAKEIQQFGGNSLASIFRGGKGVLYKEIACDVASHTGANYNDKQDIAQIESAILLKIVERSLEKMTEEERIQFFNQFGVKYEGIAPVAMIALIGVVSGSGLAFYQLAAIVAQATAKALLGKGLTFAATGSLMKGMTAFSGPVGWAITGAWTAFDLASPAYRVTVPCVIQLAYTRQKALTDACPSCKALIAKKMKFCAECGCKLAAQESQKPNWTFQGADSHCGTGFKIETETPSRIAQFASDTANSVSEAWDKHAPSKETVIGTFVAGGVGSLLLSKEELEAVGARTISAVSKAASTASDAAATAAAVVKENPKSAVVGAVVGVVAVAAAPFTGGGSVLAAATLASSLTGAGGIAVASAVVTAGAGAAISNSQNEKIKTTSYTQGVQKGIAESAVKIEELTKMMEHVAKAYLAQGALNEFIISLAAIGFSMAGCDGAVLDEEKACVQEYVIGMSKIALPQSIKDHFEKLKNMPPDFEMAISLIEKIGRDIWPPIDGLLEIISEADGDINQSEKEFLAKWENYKNVALKEGELV